MSLSIHSHLLQEEASDEDGSVEDRDKVKAEGEAPGPMVAVVFE